METRNVSIVPAVLAQYLKRHRERARVFAYRYVSWDVTEDAIGEACVQVIQSSCYDSSRPFEPYFFQVIKKVCFRMRRNERIEENEYEHIPSMQPGPEARTLLRDDLARVFRALERLPEFDKNIFAQYLLSDGPYSGTFRVALLRARKRLKALMGEEA